MLSIAATSEFSSSISVLLWSIASWSFIRVRGVRRSWLTPASMSVRCWIWRSRRLRIAMKALAAWRTSVAPEGLKFGVSRPLPKFSAAVASRRIGLTWLRMNSVATAKRMSDVPTIQKMKILVVELISRSSLAETLSTPEGNCTSISTRSTWLSVSITKGRWTISRSARERVTSRFPDGSKCVLGRMVSCS